MSVPAVDAGLVFAGWVVLFVVFAANRIARGSPGETRRDPAYRLGLLLHGIAFGLVWGFKREALASNPWKTTLIALLLVASLGLLVASLRALGRQWAVAARLVEGHELVSSGPYAYLRHPIYTAMFGMMLAAGVAWTDWRVLGIAVVLYVAGTRFRIGAEERLLRRQFGAAFEDYARRVPGFIPGGTVFGARR